MNGKMENRVIPQENPEIPKKAYIKDPVLNFLSRRTKAKSLTGSSSESSSLEVQEWKDSWKEYWLEKKFEAINSSVPRGDVVNMLSARPWGVPCGDPNQHDMPWGSCMLPMECESEFRIYRGDVFCGRTQFVCCGLQITTYDMYQGFDNSFEDSMLATSSEEKREREKGSKENKRKKRMREKRRRRRDRQRRKRKIRRTMVKIRKEIKKILSKIYRNGTSMRKKKTKQLKKFVKHLKKQYKKDRNAVKKIHVNVIKDIDEQLQQKLNQLKGMNTQFMKNSTFRDIVVNGTITPQVARILMENYPEISSMLRARKSNYDYAESKDLNYDVEYGYIYY
ncbi:unnamed protein product [Diatraea saccharalis]|uniref:Uncharacterized protein n=1 Tax=Diatraea saccharalis TaxID=40085 RepID=A0A9N9WG58_9NEOP|nr:unnamed protein product [Diatraea saccharalis]